MSTTTIRIEDDLKTRVAAAAELVGKTPHAFMIEAIARIVEEAEQDQRFRLLAEERWATLCETGMSVSWEDAKAWLLARADGEDRPKPTPRLISL